MVIPENNVQEQSLSRKLIYLYKAGSEILQAYAEKKGSLKSLVYATGQEKWYRRLLAVVCRAVDNQAAIDAALASVGLLTAEPELPPSLARLLTAELLFGTGQLVSEAKPVLTVLRYADRLRAAAAGAEAGAADDRRWSLPRYARVNTLLASVDDVIYQLTAEGWERVEYPPEITYDDFIAQVKSLSESQFLVDLHVPCLLVFPPGTELHQHWLYRRGQLILQDKASCLPPVVLAPSAGEHVLDACAAPGMKTSQLAAMMDNTGSLVAVERDVGRFGTLSTMLKKAGVTNTRLVNEDFLRMRPEDHPRVTAVLLDPSCSGTGMVGRGPEEPPSEDRLRRLSNLQGMLLRHALSFPAVRRVVYSTCSVTEHENEQVVTEALASHPGWRLAAAAPATWRRRGRTTLAGAERCIRADPAEDLCHGFFVAAFERVDGEAETGGKKRKKKRKRSEERQGMSVEIPVKVHRGEKKHCLEEATEVQETQVVHEGPREKKKKKKNKKQQQNWSETAETSEVVVEKLGTNGGDGKRSSANCNTDSMETGEPRKKKKKRKWSETVGTMDDDHEKLGVNDGKKKRLSSNHKIDSLREEEPRKKKKQKQSETVEGEEAGAILAGEHGVKKRQDSGEQTKAYKYNGIQDGRHKKRKVQNGVAGLETLPAASEVNRKKAKDERSKTLKPELAPCDVSLGAGETKKKKRKRKRSDSDEGKRTEDAASAKRDRNDKTCVEIFTSKKSKKRKNSKRLSKRRRLILKMKKPAPVTAK